MEKQLSLFRKMGYGVSELGTTATEVMIRLYLLIFYIDYVGLNSRLAGYAVALAVVWDAVTDPFITVPYAALGRELTFDADKRTAVYGWRLFFGNLGFLTGTVLPGLMLTVFRSGSGHVSQITSHARASEVLAFIIVAAALTTFFSTRGMDKKPGMRKKSSFTSGPLHVSDTTTGR